MVAVICALACFAEQFNSFTKQFGSLSVLLKTDYQTTLSTIATWLKSKATDPGLMTISIFILILLTFAISVIFGLLASGFSYVTYINCYTDLHKTGKKTKSTGMLFKEGINKRFWNMTWYFFGFFMSFIVLAFVLSYCSMPASMLIKGVIGGDTSKIFVMIVVAILTFFCIALGSLYYSMIYSFALPSVIAFKKGSFLVTIKMIREYFWYLSPRTLVFMLYNIIVKILILAMGYGFSSTGLSVIVFLLNFILTTIGYLVYLNYTFYTYIEMKDEMFDEV